jgi:hypothetical protein
LQSLCNRFAIAYFRFKDAPQRPHLGFWGL